MRKSHPIDEIPEGYIVACDDCLSLHEKEAHGQECREVSCRGRVYLLPLPVEIARQREDLRIKRERRLAAIDKAYVDYALEADDDEDYDGFYMS